MPKFAFSSNCFRKFFVSIFVLSSFISKAQTPVSGEQGDSVWTLAKSPYKITGNINVALSKTLTINPGVQVYFPPGGGNQLTVQGRIVAEGTVTDTIRFIGGGFYYNQAGPIVVENSSINSSFKYVDINSLGYYNGGVTSAALWIRSSSCVVQNCLLRNIGGVGIRVEGTTAVIKNNVFSGISRLDVNVGLDNLPLLTGNNALRVGITSQAIASTSATLTKNNIYYYLLENITIPVGKMLTINPGVQVIFPAGGGNQLTVQGTLTAEGTATDTIRFIGGNLYYNQSGPVVIENSSINSSFKYVDINSLGYYNGGVTSAALWIRSSSCVVQNCLLRNIGGVGIRVEGTTAVIKNNVFSGISRLDVNVGLDNLPLLTGNNALRVGITSQAIASTSATLTKNNIYYYLLENITIPVGKTLTINPGVQVIFPAGGGNQLTVQGTLTAEGTATDTIRFIGGNLYYNQSGPVVIENSSINSSFKYVDINSLGYYNGGVTSAALWIRSSSCVVQNCLLRNIGGVGIRVEGTTAVIKNNVFSGISRLDVNVGFDNLPLLTGNNALRVGITSQAIASTSATLTKNNIYYYLLENITIPVGKMLTINPGVQVIFPAGGGNQLTVQGTLTAEGTATDTIRFIGGNLYYNQSGPVVIENSSINSSFKYVDINSLGYYNGGVTSAALVIRSSSCIVQNCLLRNIGGTGISIEAKEVVIKVNNFSNNTQVSVISNALNLSNLSDNSNASIYILPTSLNQNSKWSNPGVTSKFILGGTITINPNYSLNIAPGSKIDFNNNGGNLVVKGSLIAAGTETDRIKFVKEAAGGTAGGTISFDSTSAGSKLINVNIDRLGSTISPAKGTAIELNTSSVNIVNLQMSNAENNGLTINKGNLLIQQSNFLNNKTGVLLAKGNAKFSECGFAGNTLFAINNTSSIITDTINAQGCWWGNAAGPRHPTNPAGTGDSVSDRVKFMPFKTNIVSSLVPDIGVSAILTPASSCNLTNIQPVKVVVSNFSNVNVNTFYISYKINNNPAVTDTTIALLIPSNSSVEYTFVPKGDFNSVGNYTIKAWTALGIDPSRTNDTSVTQVSHIAPLAKPVNLTPANNTNNLEPQIKFTWAAVPIAQFYDFYLWKASDAVPAAPIAANLTQFNFTYAGSLLQYGNSCKWKVIAKVGDCNTASDINNFSIRSLPDLIIDSISTPPTPTSESTITINWKTKNQGTGATDKPWTETIYISEIPQFNTLTSTVLGTVSYVNPLNARESYRSANFSYTIPIGKKGRYYIFIRTNSGSSLLEDNTGNNITISDTLDIQLAPPPDLQVTALSQIPANTIYADSIMKISYTVTNVGAGKTSVTVWKDKIYLSSSPVFNVDSCTLLQSIVHNGQLNSGAFYKQSNSPVKFPPYIYGTYYIYIVTDADGQLFEDLKENNNSRRSNAITVFLNPSPNLVVSDVKVLADTFTNRQPIRITWKEKNKGAAATLSNWITKVYLSVDSNLDINADTYLGYVTNVVALKSLDSIINTLDAIVPATLPENKYYCIAVTDANNNIYESEINTLGENDNIAISNGRVQVLNPDLIPAWLSSPDSAYSEQFIDLSFQVNNQSKASIYNAAWTGKIFISNDKYLDANDTLIAEIPVSTFVSANGNYTQQKSATIPRGMNGRRYLILSVDYNNSITETNENNDTLSRPIYITLSPFADLIVDTVITSATDTAGTTVILNYTARNKGKLPLSNAQWDDKVYLSPSKNLNETNLTYLGLVHQQRNLDSSQSYTQQATFTIPASLIPGAYYMHVFTDGNNSVYENASESNNRTVGDTISIAPLPYVDLAVDSATIASANIKAGQTISVKRTIRNVGNTPTLVFLFKDAVLLSNNKTPDASDRVLAEWTVNKTLNANEPYTATENIVIPQDVSGTFYLIVVTDETNIINDITRSNNYKVITVSTPGGGTTNHDTIVITQPVPCDLQVDSMSVTGSSVSGQPITVSYSVSNKGAGITQGKYWKERVLLSSDFIPSSDDILIAEHTHTDSLQPAAYYSDSVKTFLPHGISGNFAYIVMTDANNNVYEKNAENNNTAFLGTYIYPQQVSDLVVDSVKSILNTLTAGLPATIQWKTKNIGLNVAAGYKKDIVYISSDSMWDSNDVLFGSVEGTINLAPLNAVLQTLTAPVLNVVPGKYFAIVRTDILNNIDETNDSNNIGISIIPLTVIAKQLPLSVLTNDSLANNLPLYYQLKIPDSLADETLMLSLQGDSASNAINSIYLSHEKLPTQNSYDFAAQESFKANQTLYVPALKSGSYYITANGTSNNATIKQPVKLLAKTIPFSILTVNTSKGGNTGSVTVKITGARFEPGMIVKLTSGTLSITAQNLYYIDPTSAFITVNLSGMPLGIYSVQAINAANKTTVLPNSFQIETGSPGSGTTAGNGFTCSISNIGYENNLLVNEQHPATARNNTTVVITVSYKNTANVDIPLPTRLIQSISGVPISLSADFQENLQQLPLDFQELPAGPPDILRAGQGGFIKVYVNAYGPINSFLNFLVDIK